MEVPFTRFPNIFLERFKKDPYGLFFTLVIYRWTIGFRRETYKLTNAKISEESGISPSKIGEIRKRACKKAEIIYTKVKGGYEYKITILPLRKGSITPRKSVVSSEERVDYPQGKISRGAIDNTIDNYKENRILNYFLEKYPKQKSKDHHSILEAYNNLTLDEKDFLEEAIPYQLNNWKINNIAVKYIPKAEIYLNEKRFISGDVGKSVKQERARIDMKKKQIQYENEANQNACSDEEKLEALASYIKK